MKRFVLRFVEDSDDLTLVTLPIRDESKEDIIRKFKENLGVCATNTIKESFELYGWEFIAKDVNDLGIPEVFTVDEWFETFGAKHVDS